MTTVTISKLTDGRHQVFLNGLPLRPPTTERQAYEYARATYHTLYAPCQYLHWDSASSKETVLEARY
jgi:hypothetical protein